MKRILRRSRSVSAIGLAVLSACGQIETGYFQSKVDQVTQDVVARRYGTPHRVDKLSDGRSVWTYFDRGSGTTGYGGYAPSSRCWAYVLTFDQTEVLRDWRQQDCTASSATTVPPSDHN
ncbi:MAG: hypothetical protein A4E19_19190 [Nitrospira sp. SG-bin1]|nr:MAG: hypothetical protein A4E19_19190 [Nitrospira sp. SG-bin1]